MSGERSFREIFFEQLGQKRSIPEAKQPYYDPTLSETMPVSSPRFEFFSRQNQRSYTSSAPKNSRHETQRRATTPPPPSPRPERRLEAQHVLTPQQKASLHLIEDHLGKQPLLPLSESAFKRLYRLTMKKCHPDQGGDARTFVRVRQAFKELERAFPPRLDE